MLLSAVAARLSAASADLAGLLDLFGLTRAGGFDADALDRLLHDPAETLRGRLASDPDRAATALRALVPAADGVGSTLAWSVGSATVGFDLATGSLVGSLSTALPDLADLSVTVMTSATASSLRLAAGALDPTLGGVRVVADLATGAGATAAIELAGPGRPASRLELWPALAPEPVAGLVAVLVPALGLKALAATALDLVSEASRPLLEEALAILGMLPALTSAPDALADPVAGAVTGPAAGVRRLVLPIGLVSDPAAWFAGLVRGGNLTLGPAGVALLDALAPLVVPDRGTDPGWPLAEGLSINYADDGGRLSLLLRATLEEEVGGGAGGAPPTTVTTGLTAGVVLGLGTPPQPHVALDVGFEGPGIRVTVDPTLRDRTAPIRSGPAAAVSRRARAERPARHRRRAAGAAGARPGRRAAHRSGRDQAATSAPSSPTSATRWHCARPATSPRPRSGPSPRIPPRCCWRGCRRCWAPRRAPWCRP